MPTYQTPGVFCERFDAVAPAISAIRTDVAGFVGIAERGPVGIALPVESWRQFRAQFGGFIGSGFLAYAVRAFFENGGRRCWVVRVASGEPLCEARPAAIVVSDTSGKPAWRITASSPGRWGNELSITITETHRQQTRTEQGKAATEYSVVKSIGSFTRGTLVRLSQRTNPSMYKVVSDVDPQGSLLVWVNARPERRLDYDSPLRGFDLNKPITVESVEYTIIVRQSNRLIAVYEGLSLVPEHERYGPKLLCPVALWKSDGERQAIPAAPGPLAIEELRKFDDLGKLLPVSMKPIDLGEEDSRIEQLTGGSDGLAQLQPDDFMGEELLTSDGDKERTVKIRGIKALGSVDEISIVAVPDIHVRPIVIGKKFEPPICKPDPCLPDASIPPASAAQAAEIVLPPVFSDEDIYRVQAALVQHCEERRDRIALLEPPYAAVNDRMMGGPAVQAWRSRFESKYAAFYYPWVRVLDPLNSGDSFTRDIPPCGHIAGQYAKNDIEFGVHRAPANMAMAGVQDLTVLADDAVHGLLNPLGINVMRSLPGRGIRILGARTVSSDPDWRYVNVRRLLMMIEKAIGYAMQWAVFEPNNVYTRFKINLSLTSFLTALWQGGALVGKSKEEAFFVKCDEENNSRTDRDNGRLLAEIGVAPSLPWEFIVVRVGRTNDTFEMSEYSMSGGM
jgi:Bacteriophage tail sheath protein